MALPQDQIRALDQMRQRIYLLSTSIGNLRKDLENSDPLPTWPTLQSSAQALSFNLTQLMETFNSHRRFLKEAHAYPLTSFPGHTQENLLGLLLRKKLEPAAESWIESYTGKFRPDGGEGGRLEGDELKELWSWAAPTSFGIMRPMMEEDGAFHDDFTIGEREEGVEKVVTGLERRLDGDGSEDDDDEDGEDGEKMEDVMPSTKMKSEEGEKGVDTSLPALPIDSVLRFMSTGVLPGNGRLK